MPKAPQLNSRKTNATPTGKAEMVPTKLEIAHPKTPMIEKSSSEDDSRPKNLKANILPTEGYVLEVDGKFKLEYKDAEAAKKAGLELKKKYSSVQVKVFDSKERTRTAVELPE
jgi:hypothetical protein